MANFLNILLSYPSVHNWFQSCSKDMHSDFAFSTTYWSNDTSLLSQTGDAERQMSLYSNTTYFIFKSKRQVRWSMDAGGVFPKETGLFAFPSHVSSLRHYYSSLFPCGIIAAYAAHEFYCQRAAGLQVSLSNIWWAPWVPVSHSEPEPPIRACYGETYSI